VLVALIVRIVVAYLCGHAKSYLPGIR
jgi:hypothetical protein